VWIIVVAVLLVACCCVLVAAAGAAVWLSDRYAAFRPGPFDLGGQYQERSEETFEVGDTPSLEIANFAGSVTIRSGEGGVVRVVATKRSSSRSRVERIELSMAERDGRVVIKVEEPFPLKLPISVYLEITAPATSRLDLELGAGTVDVQGISGPIDIQDGAGSVDVRGARGAARVDVGAGQIRYEGEPSGECRFETGAGEIILRLPADLNMQLDVSTGAGAVSVDYDVDGQVSTTGDVEGVVGDGSEGSIYAHSGAGSISVEPR
jgi:hypothetical protein